MTIEALVARFGLLALFVGTGVEGETVAVLGGVLAHKHLLSPYGAAIAAFGGSFAADQILFWTGRWQHDRPWVRRLEAKPAFAKALAALERHPARFIIAYRFIYGIRTISPVAIGTSQVPAARFVALNVVAAGIWGPLFTGVGYLFGTGLLRTFGRLAPFEHWLIVVGGILLGIVALVAGVRWHLEKSWKTELPAAASDTRSGFWAFSAR